MQIGLGIGTTFRRKWVPPLTEQIRSLLFSASEPGAWYDPSDMSTLFQDSAGTTPVTAVEQPVGLILDKSLGAALGAELATSAWLNTFGTPFDTFTSTSGSGFTAAVTSGKSPRVRVPLTLTTGKSYKVTFDLVSTGVSSLAVYLDNGNYSGAVNTGISNTANGTKQAIVAAASASTGLMINPIFSGAGSITVSNVSVKELPGNHATQATTTKRPVLSRRVNCIGSADTRTLANAALLKSGTGLTPIVTPNYAMAPDGTMTAIRVQMDCGSGQTSTDYSLVSAAFPTGHSQLDGAAYRTKMWMRATLGTAAVVVVGAGYVVAQQTLTETWTFVSLSETGAAGSAFALRISSNGGHPASRGAQDILIWQPQLTLATDQNLPHQWNKDSSTYDADPAKFPAYLRFDGVDDALQTGNIDFTSTDKMTVWAGVTKLSNSDYNSIMEHGTTSANADVSVWAPFNGSNYRGDAAQAGGYAAITPALPAPRSDVLSLIGDRASGRVTTLRVAGGVYQSALGVPPGGNYTNQSLYIGARAGTSNFFNGRLYSLIVRGAQTPLSQIEATELYIKQKMRMP